MANATHIPFVYRIYFLWNDPITTVITTYFCLFRRGFLVSQLIPSLESYDSAYNPLLWQIAGLYILITVLQGGLLRYTSDVGVWKFVCFGVLLVDFMILGSLVEMHYGPDGLSLENMQPSDWMNVGMTTMAAVSKAAFVAGIGLKSAETKSEKKSS